MNKINLKIFAIILITIFLAGCAKAEPNPKLDAFAQCLRDKGVTMYGAYWCSHCQNEKKNFGDSFQYVPYVECTKEIKKCQDAGIKGYPTWIFPGGKKLEGEQGLENLATESGCESPL